MASKDQVIAAHKAHPEWNSVQIAKHLRCVPSYVRATFERNGLRLPSRKPPKSKKVEAEEADVAAPPVMPKPPRKVFACEPTAGLRVADVVPLHLNLLDLEPGQCRWPFGDGPFTFCGCEQFGGSSYCEPHLSLAQGQGSRGEQMAHRGIRSAA